MNAKQSSTRRLNSLHIARIGERRKNTMTSAPARRKKRGSAVAAYITSLEDMEGIINACRGCGFHILRTVLSRKMKDAVVLLPASLGENTKRGHSPKLATRLRRCTRMWRKTA